MRVPQKLLEHWAVSSQSKACRNAMLAATILAQHRAEILDVDEFFSTRFPAVTQQRLTGHG
ncbi:hypothetical protein ncot_05445 [Nocardioides sp. JQ2195]|uniref:hypothetical protein n=1 Tax=Nocardioides sp. JQ2195 TaxID=2592334 RepID=UPI00143E52BB|nr:hypothetical protein [Nocardioides sp. JQ2195]QIX26104.1 hypothetical protein ncot_05445 [Nocardioides sp. JQ2195]